MLKFFSVGNQKHYVCVHPFLESNMCFSKSVLQSMHKYPQTIIMFFLCLDLLLVTLW